GRGRHHHRRRLVLRGTRRPRRGRAPGARGRGRSHGVRRRGADDDRAGRPPAGSGRPVHDDRVRSDRPGGRLGRGRRVVGGRPGARLAHPPARQRERHHLGRVRTRAPRRRRHRRPRLPARGDGRRRDRVLGRRDLDRAGERDDGRLRIAADPAHDRQRRAAGPRGRRRARRARRPVRADASCDLDAARHGVRPQAGGQERRPEADDHAQRHPLRNERRRHRRGAARRDRFSGAGHAGGRPGAAGRPPEHLPDQRPDRRGRLGHGHIQRRLGVRRWASADAKGRARRGRPTCTEPGYRGPAAHGRWIRIDRRCGIGRYRVSSDRVRSPALTSFVVASRYMPVYIALLLLLIVASIWAPATLSGVALRAIAPYGAILGIAALGQMLVIMTGGIDLSVPGTMSLAAVIIVGVGDGSNENIWIAVATAVAIAALIGLVNGLLIGGLKLNALITTLAVGLIVAGVVNRYASTFPVQSRVPPGLSDWISTRIFGVSPVFWIGVGLSIALIVGLRYTAVGRRFQAVGANPIASHVVGVHVNLNQILV